VAILLLVLAAVVLGAVFLWFHYRGTPSQWQTVAERPDTDTELAQKKVGQSRLVAGIGAAAVLVLLLAGALVWSSDDNANADNGDGDGNESTSTTMDAATTPTDPDSDVCPNGTTDDLRFELSELEHPQALTPAWPQDYEEQTKFLFGPAWFAATSRS
jgi:heme A synthase